MNKKVVLWVRIIFGVLLVVMGVGNFLNLPLPESNPASSAFLNALRDSGYIFYASGLIWIIVGLMFVVGRYVALGAVLLAPITVNIILFHIFLDLGRIIPGLVLLLLNVFVAYAEMDKYRALLRSK